MRLNPSMRARPRHRSDEGFTMIFVLGVLVVVMGLSVAAFAAVRSGLPLTANDTLQKQAYAAAQAGVQRYLYDLDQNSEFWTQCVPASPTWINNPKSSPTSRGSLAKAPVPGATQFPAYAVELLPATGQTTYTQCSTANPVASMIQASGSGGGTIRIRSTGFAGPTGNVMRTVVANLREQSFLDYEWYTDYETSDPALQVASAYLTTLNKGDADNSMRPPDQCVTSPPARCGTNYSTAVNDALQQCGQYRGSGRYTSNQLGFGAGAFFKDVKQDVNTNTTYSYYCDQTQANEPAASVVNNGIQFAAGDAINGPFHSNDEVQVCPGGSPNGPRFGRNSGDSIEFGDTTGYVLGSGCSGTPNIQGTRATTFSHISTPPSNGALANIATLSYAGTTCIKLQVGGMLVAQPGQGANVSIPSCFSPTLTWSPASYPSNGVLYVANGTCSLTYDVENPNYSGNNGCGTVYVSGVDEKPLTIGADNDIVIDGDLTYSDPSTSMLGLIATHFIRVYHPVGSQPLGTNTTPCSGTDPATLKNLTIDAMMLSLKDSFVVDQYNCGALLGNLTINGGIAQVFRGPVGTSGGTGYIKNYTYDDRLRYEEPPHFIDPVQGSWRVQRQTECDTTGCYSGAG